MSEKRRCNYCGHTGIDDYNDEVSVCSFCLASQPVDCEDSCPECHHENFMVVACPVCEGIYSLVEVIETTQRKE